MALNISPRVQQKLSEKHNVTRAEIEQCFANRAGKMLEDTREDHLSDPPTQWFIAVTDSGRKLKVVFIMSNKTITIRTAYEPNITELQIYHKHG